MYEILEHWKQYKLEKDAKDLQKKIAQEIKLNEKKEAIKELGEFIDNLAKKNGTTKY